MMSCRRILSNWTTWLTIIALCSSVDVFGQDHGPSDAPRAHDPRLVVDLFCAAPQIVHPIALDFDANGRLLVIESHTHFRPSGYEGPPSDRVRVLEDTDGDGNADRFSTFYEGTRFTMDIATYFDRSVYLATRNEILRLRDLDGDGKAEDAQRIVFLDTAGNYPHNGLSGLAFDSSGDLLFGMGENLGASYTLSGQDGVKFTGGGEGGSIYRCSPLGKNLRRVATGFWNPFGLCRDIFGRFFAVDNDPDSMPPCRLVHVVEGGDYGYQFRYGRSGRHVFQAWNGELPGTLPMVSGTGEAPCEVIAYESDGLPQEYVGNLFVPTWADHRIERFVLKARGASVVAEPEPFVQGGKDFRPSGLAAAPDGSFYVSDWVLRDYNLHGRGAVWHVRWKDAARVDRPADATTALHRAHGPWRESAARRLARTDEGRETLRKGLANDSSVRLRATSLTALVDSSDSQVDLERVAEKDSVPSLRAIAVRALVARGGDVARFVDAGNPAEVRCEAIRGLKGKDALAQWLAVLKDDDRFLRNAAVQALAHAPELLSSVDRGSLSDPLQRVGLLLAQRASGSSDGVKLIPEFLADPDEDVRFLAVKWIADEKLESYKSRLVEALKDTRLNVRMYSALSTALARLNGQDVSESNMGDYFFVRLADDRSPLALRVKALQLMPANHPRLTLDLLSRLLNQGEPALQEEAVRALGEHRDSRRWDLLLGAACDSKKTVAVRAQAIVELASHADAVRGQLFQFVESDIPTLRDEALRALIGTALSQDENKRLDAIGTRAPEAAPLVRRLLGQPLNEGRPPLDDLDGWMTRLRGPSQIEAGRRVFAHAKLAACSRCHRVEGRGKDVGPDLSTIGRRERKQILESILQPSASVGPSYQNWQIATVDGRVLTGLLVKTDLDQVTFVDPKGTPFSLGTSEIAERRALSTSIMPAGFADLLTDQELRDLLAYLSAQR